uniref:Uncharacterized protein n=1 Tax=Aegilops tauschii subsp. strangulata TaxID=200361 RepID=A0A453IMP4_AEGTS
MSYMTGNSTNFRVLAWGLETASHYLRIGRLMSYRHGDLDILHPMSLYRFI